MFVIFLSILEFLMYISLLNLKLKLMYIYQYFYNNIYKKITRMKLKLLAIFLLIALASSSKDEDIYTGPS